MSTTPGLGHGGLGSSTSELFLQACSGRLRAAATFLGPWLPVVVAAAVAMALLSPALFCGYVLSPADVILVGEGFIGPTHEPANRLLTDVAFAFEPWLIEARRQLRVGQWPWLNPYAGLGAPLFGNLQSALLCPFNWPFLLTGSPRAFAWQALAKLLCAAAGVVLLSRHLALGRSAQTLAAVCYMLGGFMSCWLLYPLASSAAWFPWLCWSLLGLVRRPSTRQVAIVAVTVALAWLGGHPETVMHSVLGAALFAVMAFRPLRPRTATIAAVSAVLLGTAVAAVQLVPFFSYLSVSNVWERGSATGRTQPARRLMISAASTVCMLVPFAYGSYGRRDAHVEKALGLENFNEIASGYCGVLIPALALLAVLGRNRAPRWVRAAGMLAVLGWLVGYRWFPFYDALHLVPGVAHVQHQRLLLWPTLFAPLVAAYGLHQLSTVTTYHRPIRVVTLAYAVLCTTLALGAVAVVAAGPRLYAHAREHYENLVRQGLLDRHTARLRLEQQGRRAPRALAAHYLHASALMALAVNVLWASSAAASTDGKKRWVRKLGLGPLWLLVVIDLASFSLKQWPFIRPGQWFPPPAASLSDASPLDRTLFLQDVMPPNAATVYGVSDPRLYDGMEHAGLDRLFRCLDPASAGTADVRGQQLLRRHDWRHKLLAVLGVKWIVARSPAETAPCLRRAGSFGRATVWQLACQRDTGLWLLPPAKREPQTELDWPELVQQLRPLDVAELHWVSANKLVAHLAPQAGGIPEGTVVLGMLWLPGWQARAGGVAAELRPVAGTLIGVEVTPGTQQLELSYRPPGLGLAAAVTLLGLAASCALFRYDRQL